MYGVWMRVEQDTEVFVLPSGHVIELFIMAGARRGTHHRSTRSPLELARELRDLAHELRSESVQVMLAHT